MNGKSTLWIILFLLSAGAAGTGFYLNYQKSRDVEEFQTQAKEYQTKIESLSKDMATYQNKNQELEQQIQQLKASTTTQQAADTLSAQLKSKEEEIKKLTERFGV